MIRNPVRVRKGVLPALTSNLPADVTKWGEEARHWWLERVAIMLEAEPDARPERVKEAERDAEACAQAWFARPS